MDFNSEQLRADVRQATTEDLLDRATVYRTGMEAEALRIIEAELARRHIAPTEIAAHAAKLDSVILRDAEGVGMKCSFCRRPAVVRRWSWREHLIGAKVPLVFPRRFKRMRGPRPASAAGKPRAAWRRLNAISEAVARLPW